MTLDAVENREVRPVFHDARVHVALNCAAGACAVTYRPYEWALNAAR